MDHLTWAYCSLRDAWQTLSTDKDCDEAAPWNQWMNASTGPVTEREILLQVAQLAAADAGKSVLHHLRLLARAYPPDALADDGLDPNGWPGFASYTVARAVLEGAAVIAWLLQPDHDERCRRSARLQLWSACELRKGALAPPAGQPGSVEAIQAIVEGAGFEVREFGRATEGGRDVGVVIDGQPRPFYTSEAVRTLLGPRGKAYYHGWSGTAHHAPWALMPWTTIRRADNDAGLHLSTSVFEDKHVELAADIATVIRAAGISVGDFYGRETNMYLKLCTDVDTHLRAQIPSIRQALGRPGNDPTHH
jgi:hypothetical protein